MTLAAHNPILNLRLARAGALLERNRHPTLTSDEKDELDRWRQTIAGAVAEVDLEPVAISRHLTPAQGMEQMQSIQDADLSPCCWRVPSAAA